MSVEESWMPPTGEKPRTWSKHVPMTFHPPQIPLGQAWD